jgi:hypothetical protein
MKQTLNKIPTKCMEWLVSSRIKFLHTMKDGHPTKYFAAHLPVMATWNQGQSFPVNMTVKGLGLLPDEDSLQHYTDIFESVIAEARAMPWQESMHIRLKAISTLYGDIENRIQYISFQVNSTVTILEKEDPYYRFLLASRKLFEFDKFHLYQPDYPFGYLIKVAEVIDKSPWSRKPERQ